MTVLQTRPHRFASRTIVVALGTAQGMVCLLIGQLRCFCESCHGAGSGHVAEQHKDSNPTYTDYGTVTEATCLTCHTTENSPKFDFTHYFPKIVHTIVVENAHETTH